MDPKLRAQIAAALYKTGNLQQLSPALKEALNRQPSQGEMLMQRWGQWPGAFATDMVAGMLDPFFQTGINIGKNADRYFSGETGGAPVSAILGNGALEPAAQMASQYAPGGSLSDFLFGTGEGFDPFAENISKGNYGVAAGQLQGAIADAAMAASPFAAILLGMSSDRGREIMKAIEEAPKGTYEGDDAIQKIWDDFGAFQGPDARWYKEYPDTYEIPTLDELGDIWMARAQQTGQALPDAPRVGDLMPNRGDTLFQDVPGFAETPLKLLDMDPRQRGYTAGDGSEMGLNARGSPEPTIPHEGTHLANILAKTGAQGGDPGTFTPDNAWFDPAAAQAAKSVGITDPMEAYGYLWGETLARMAGNRRMQFLNDETWPTKSPVYNIDVYPGSTFARPSEMTGDPMHPAFKNLWWNPDEAKAAQDAADAEAARLVEQMKATRPQSSIDENGSRFSTNEGLRSFGPLPGNERVTDWYNEDPANLPGWQGSPRPDAPAGYAWNFGQLPKEDLLRDGYPLDARIFDWYLEPTGRTTPFERTSLYGPETPPKTESPPQSSILTYHGSPNYFERPSLDRAGESMGNTEGRGFYSGQEPAVAQTYRDPDGDLGTYGTWAYATDLKGEPGDYLDLDRPFSQQSPDMISRLEKVLGPKPADTSGTIWEANPFHVVSNPGRAGGTPWKTAEDVRQSLYNAGILGTRYLDAGSRTKGSGTSNFVSFNPEGDVRILGSTSGDITELVKRFQSAPDRAQMSIAVDGINRRLSEAAQPHRPSDKTSRGGSAYIGAPPGVNSPEAEAALVGDLANAAKSEAGIEGMNFYNDYQRRVREMTDDPVKAQRHAALLGNTSNNTDPGQNENYAVKGFNQHAVGAEINTGAYPNDMRARIEENLANGRLPAHPKTGQYAYNTLPPESRPDDFGDYAPVDGRTNRPVHDKWDWRAQGYATEASGDINRHRYSDWTYDNLIQRLNADPETRALAGPDGWNVENTQAAIWAAARGEPNPGGVVDKAVNDVTAITQMAAIPGASTGADPRLLDGPFAQKVAWTDSMFNAIKDKNGRSRIASALALTGPMRVGAGPWRDPSTGTVRMEPNRVIPILTAGEGFGTDGSTLFDGTKGPPRSIDPASDLVARTVRRWHQVGFGQEGSGLTFPYDRGLKAGDRNLGVIDGMALNGYDDYDRAFQTAQKIWGDDFADKVVVQPTIDNSGIMIKDITGDNAAFQKNMKAFSKAMGQDAAPRFLKDVGNQFDYVRWDNPAYRSLLAETASNPDLKKVFDEYIIPEYANIQKAADQWAQETGIPANTVPDRLRRVIIQGGKNWPAAIDAAVKKGIIPSVAGIVAYNAMLRYAGQDGSQSGVH